MSETRTVAINVSYGGFGLSEECAERYHKLSGRAFEGHYPGIKNRSDPHLIRALRQCVDDNVPYNGAHAIIYLVDVAVDFCDARYCTIEEDDGMERLKFNVAQYKLDKIRELVTNAANTTPEAILELIDQKIQTNWTAGQVGHTDEWWGAQTYGGDE